MLFLFPLLVVLVAVEFSCMNYQIFLLSLYVDSTPHLPNKYGDATPLVADRCFNLCTKTTYQSSREQVVKHIIAI